MGKAFLLLTIITTVVLAGCGTPVPTLAPTVSPGFATIVSPSGYRPLQTGDMLEGVAVAYYHIVPSIDQPVVVLAFGPNLLQLVIVKTELTAGLAAYVRELPKGKSIYAFDEATPDQKEPKLLDWDATRPVEVAFIPLAEDKPHTWSVTEGEDKQVYAAYKLIRRRDGGLRFVDAYSTVALQSANNTYTPNGGGIGLMLSARLALLRTILSDARYQRGANVMETYPPETGQYDSRVLSIDPSLSGLAMNKDWVLFSRPSPNPGLSAP